MDKVTLDRFASALRRGTGEAILILRQHPQLNCRELLLHAAVNNLAYDPQCEGSREDYLYELIGLSPEKRTIEDALIQHLITSTDDNWGVLQLFRLVGLMAGAGNTRAREAVYWRYAENLNPDFPFVDTYVLIDLDGYEGLKFMAEVKGKLLLDDPEDWDDDDYLLRHAQDLLPDMAVEARLEQDAARNESIRAYLEGIKRSRESQEPYQPATHDYHSLKAMIDSGGKMPFGVGRKLSPGHLEALAEDFLAETDEEKVLYYLKIFANAPFPRDPAFLLGFLGHDNPDVTHQAINALRPFRRDDIRQAALYYLTAGGSTTHYLELLIENYREEDRGLITEVLRRTENADEFHGAGLSVIHIYEDHPDRDGAEPLQFIYDKGTCGLCRLYAVEILLKNNALPAYIREEGLYDCNENIRKLVQNK